MGICGSQELVEHDQGASKSREVNSQLAKDEEESQNVHKLLLLGPGNSGKSTFFKQIVDLHCGGWTDEDRMKFKPNIHDSIIEQMQMLLSMVRDDFEVDLSEPLSQYQGKEYMEKVAKELALEEADAAEESLDDADEGEMDAKSEEYQPSDEELRAAEKLVEQADLIEDLAKDAIFDNRIAEAIKVVWSDQRVKDVFDCKITIGVADSCPYFFGDIARFAEADFVPSMEDILMARNSTVGIRHKEFEAEKDKFEIFDVGGQRNERGKWLHIFDNVRAVLFVTSLSCYDQTLFEDDTTNAMEESLELWDSICNSPYFAAELTSLVIFFNKKDLFQIKLSDKKPLTIAFPEYTGPNEYKPAYEFIMKTFEDKQSLFEHRTVYCHATQATDKHNVRRVLYDVTHNAVVSALHANGIM